jgi:hypothetical protein
MADLGDLGIDERIILMGVLKIWIKKLFNGSFCCM